MKRQYVNARLRVRRIAKQVNKMLINTKTSGVALHFEKHKGNDTGVNGLQRHNERIPGSKHGNKNIDDTRTHENVFLRTSPDKYNKQITEIITNNREGQMKGVRKNAVRMVEATVQLSGKVLDESENDQEQVLRSSFEWLKQKFGDENILSAVIHKDETNMHLHFDFVPLKEGRLIAREIISRPKLQQYQREFLEFLQDEHANMNFKRGESETKGLSQHDFEIVEAEKKRLNDENEAYVERLEKREDDIDKREDSIEQRENYLESRELQLDSKEQNLKSRENAVTNSESHIKSQENQLNAEKLELRKREQKVKDYQKALNDNYNNAKSAITTKQDDLRASEQRLLARNARLEDERKKVDEKNKRANEKLSEANKRLLRADEKIAASEKTLEEARTLTDRWLKLQANVEQREKVIADKLREMYNSWTRVITQVIHGKIKVQSVQTVMDNNTPLTENNLDEVKIAMDDLIVKDDELTR